MNDARTQYSAVLPGADPEEVGLSATGLARLTAAMQREVDSRHVPGVSMMIARSGKVAYRQDVGALRPDGPPLGADAIFRIYSMTKPIVSVALMMLVEEGKLFIADPIAKFVPELASPKVGVVRNGKLELEPIERAITIQDLLRHTSGLTYLSPAIRRCSAFTVRRTCSLRIRPTPRRFSRAISRPPNSLSNSPSCR